jgi:hypothetical protein
MKKKEDRLIQAVSQMADLPDDNKVNIKGKLYAEVHTRVQAFREAYGEEGRIMTTIHQHDDEKVMTETTIQILRNDRWDTIGNDFAEEYRGVGMVNKTSALENCITSSIGRALSACGLSGGNYASFEEVDHAMNEKAESKPKKKTKAVKAHNREDAEVKAHERKEVDEIPDVLKWNDFKTEKDADDFLEAFVKFADMHDMSVESLRGYYKANFKNITLLYDNFPEKKKELDDIVTKRKEEIEQKLSAKEAEKNG